jgi:Mn2+/Fe2+ NRAMP family transporter
LTKKFSQAKYFYVLIALITAMGAVINITSISPFRLLYYTAVINGIVAPFILGVILWLSNSKKVVGSRTNGIFSNIFGALSTIIMFAAAAFFIVSEIVLKK